MSPTVNNQLICSKRSDYQWCIRNTKVIHIVEGGLGTIFGCIWPATQKEMEAALNKAAAQGWVVVFQVLENKRFWLFWRREAVIVTLGR